MQEPQETQVPSLGWEDPLEEGMATYSSILAWGISWTEEPGGLQSIGSQSRTRLSDFHSLRDHPTCLQRLIPSPSHSELPICVINWGFPGGTSG